MAVIGNAEVIISPITKGFEAKLRRDLQGISGMLNGNRAGQNFGETFQRGFNSSISKNPMGKFADGLRNMAPEAEAAREKFQSLVRTGYVLQGVIGPLIGGLSSLVVSLGTLVGTVGKAVPAVAALANGFVALKVAMAVVKFGFGDIASAVKQATDPTKAMGKSIAELREEFQQLMFDAEEATQSESRAALKLEDAMENLRRVQDLPPNSRARREAQLAVEEADLAYRRAKDRAADLNEEVAKGQDEFIKKNQQAAGTDPFANLNEAQREFAEYLVGLKPLIDDLELDISRALLPPLKDAVDILVEDLYPVLRQRLPEVAAKAGEAMKGVAVDVTSPENLQKIDNILVEMQPNLELMGDLFGNILDIILSILDATGPLVNDFLTWAVGKTQEWSDTLTEMNADGRLDKFFEEAGAAAADFGEIFGNIFAGIGNLIGLTTGPDSAGEGMIQWMKDGSAAFANMFSEDPEGGKQFFKDAFENAKSVMSSIGALLGEILGLADNPNIGKTFDTLKEGAPSVGEMLGKMIDAGPSFAELVVTLTEIANQLTDDKQISAFFDTLNKGAEKFKEFLDSDFAKNLLNNLGPIFATLSAVGVIFDVIRFGFNVAVGYIAYMLGFFDPVMNFFSGLKGGKGLGGLAKLLKGGGIIGLIILLISKATEFYNTIDSFKQMVDNVFANVKESFERMMQPLSELFEKLFGEGEGSLLTALNPVIELILNFLIPALGNALSWIMNILTFVLEMANNLLDWVIPVVKDIADAIGLLFEGDVLGFLRKIFEAFGTFILGGIQFVVNSVIDLLNFVIRAANDMLSGITNGPFGSFLKDVFGLDLSGVKIPEIAKVDWTGDIEKRQNNQALQEGYGGSRFGGADARAPMSSTVNATANATTRITGLPAYAEYQKPTNEINVTVNAQAMDPNEMASAVSREIAISMKKGSI